MSPGATLSTCIRVIAVCLLGLAGCAQQPQFVSSAPPAPPPPLALIPGDVLEVNYYPTNRASSMPYRLAVGDQLRIDVANHPDLSRERVQVLSDGRVALPLAGQVQALGLTLDQLGELVTQSLRAAHIRSPSVVVGVVEGEALLRSLTARRGGSSTDSGNLFEVSDLGLLSLPGIAPLEAQRPLAQLREDIQRAYRGVFNDQLEVVVNLRQAKARAVHVIGEVVRPGLVEFKVALNLMTAVASAGGMTATASPDKVVLVRYHADGTHSQWLLDLGRALTQGDQSAAQLSLRANDVIFVPKSGVALANDVIDQFVRRMIPIPIGVGISIQP